jgi:hypothetical protein
MPVFGPLYETADAACRSHAELTPVHVGLLTGFALYLEVAPARALEYLALRHHAFEAELVAMLQEQAP